MAAPSTHIRPARNSVLAGRRARAMMRAIRGRSVQNGAATSRESRVPPSGPESAVVDWAFYRDGKRQDDVPSYADAVSRASRGGGFVWIGLYEPTEHQLAGIAEEFDLHPLAVEDAVTAHQRPKLEHYDDSLFVVFKTVAYCPHEELTATSEIVDDR